MAISQKAATRLAWGLWTLATALAVAGLFMVRANAGSVGDDLLIVPVVAMLSGVGALVASRRPNNVIGWLLLLAGCGAVVGFVAGEYARYAVLRAIGPRWMVSTVGWASEWVWLPSMGLLPTYLILLFPDGRLPSARW
ncbi:MAG: hypothetical protein LC722_02190, partial [Actinobacteria bacterium]|nr:hypothetical protein [Actinomycetota bacterium]